MSVLCQCPEQSLYSTHIKYLLCMVESMNQALHFPPPSWVNRAISKTKSRAGLLPGQRCIPGATEAWPRERRVEGRCLGRDPRTEYDLWYWRLAGGRGAQKGANEDSLTWNLGPRRRKSSCNPVWTTWCRFVRI